MCKQSDAQDVRNLFAQLINAPSGECIAFCPSTAFAMTMAVHNIRLTGLIQTGKNILLLEREMGSVVYPWQELCSTMGCKLKVVHKPFGTSWTAAILKAIDTNVAILSIPHVHWCDGAFIDLEEIRTALDAIPAAYRPHLVVDGTQSIGVMPFNVETIRPLFVVCSVHKWCNAPYGMSLVYVDPSHSAHWQPLDQVTAAIIATTDDRAFNTLTSLTA